MEREEAIKELRGFIGQLTEGCQEAIKVLIPELAESEDERMLRTIIRGFEAWKGNGNVKFNNTSVDDILAWLEKQKEKLGDISTILLVKKEIERRIETWQKSRKELIAMECNTLADDAAVRIEELYSLISFLGTIRCNTNEKQKEQKPINHNFTTFHRDVVYCAMCDKNLDEGLRCNLEIVYKIIKDIVDRTPVVEEQKPADLSDMMVYKEPYIAPVPTPIVADEQKPVECIEFDNEFEKQVSHLLASVLNGEWEYNEDFVKYAAQSLLGFAKNEMKPDEWDKREKLFRKALQAANARIGQLFEENQKLKEQKPEWSEEDRIMLNDIIRCLPSKSSAEFNQKRVNWLKSLPERFNLRPKEEWSEDKYPKNIENAATMFCFDNGLNITPHQAVMIAKHFYELGFKRMSNGRA